MSIRSPPADKLLVRHLNFLVASRQIKPNMKGIPEDTRPHLRLPQPHNAYNIYFILERQRLIDEMESRMWDPDAVKKEKEEFSLHDLTGSGYDFLSLPDFPPRFINLNMPHGWYVPGRNSKRKHVRSHGLLSFNELTKTISSSWKVLDNETKQYCYAVAEIITKRYKGLIKVGGMCCLPTIDSSSTGQKMKNLVSRVAETPPPQQHACLPCAPNTSGDLFSVPDWRGRDYPGKNASMEISPIVREQSTVNICGDSVMDMLQQYQQFQMLHQDWATNVLDNDDLDRSNVKDPDPTPSDLISMATGIHQYDTQTGISAIFDMCRSKQGY